MKIPSPNERAAEHERASVCRRQALTRSCHESGSELAKICHVGYVELDEAKSYDVAAHRLDARDAARAHVDHNGALGSSLAWLWAAGLEIAGVDHPGFFGLGAAREDHPGVNVPEGPVVEPNPAEVFEAARAVVAVAGGGTTDIAMKDANLDPGSRPFGESQRQIVGLASLGETDALDGCQRDSVTLEGDRLGGTRTEDGDARWPGVAQGRPADLHRVVVAVDDEARDTRVGQALKAVTKAKLCSKAAFWSVVDVAGDYEEGNLALQAQIDE